jgi:hypothetical protein
MAEEITDEGFTFDRICNENALDDVFLYKDM